MIFCRENQITQKVVMTDFNHVIGAKPELRAATKASVINRSNIQEGVIVSLVCYMHDRYKQLQSIIMPPCDSKVMKSGGPKLKIWFRVTQDLRNV